MPLSLPVKRELLHTRTISYQAYRREDGLWDVEAYLTDIKTQSFEHQWQGTLPAGEPLHQMLARLTIDSDFTVVGIETCLEHFPLEMCPEIIPNYQSLRGLRVGPGWRTGIKERVGSVRGCTHLTELLFPMATVAMQSIMPVMREEKGYERSPGERPHRLDSCHSWATDSPAVKRYNPEFYTGN